jgi:glycosyltransferase involved in cell wall biosynthesis
VLLEAAASGKPLVGSNVGGIPDYIDHGETGFLFEKENPTDLAAKLLEILGDRNLAARMGQAARARVEREFRYDQMIDNLLAVFEEVIAAHRT